MSEYQRKRKRKLLKNSEEAAFIKTLDGSNTIPQIMEIVNEKFDADFGYEQIKSFLWKNHVPYRRNSRHNLLITDEQAEILMKIIPGRQGKDIVRIFQEETGVRLTLAQLRSWKKNHKCPSGYDTRWRPGHESTYRTPKGRINRGTFKKGNRSANCVPIGTERLRSGYVYVKYRDGHLNKNWKQKSIMIWEEKNGPLPEGKTLLFLDGNPLNCSVENLLLIDKGTLAVANVHYGMSKDPDTNKTIISAAKLRQSIVKAQNRKKEKSK